MSYTEPLLFVFFVLSFAGLCRIWRGRGQPKPVLLTSGLLGLFLSCWAPADWLFSRALELPYAKTGLPAGDPQAIVVLAGDVAPPLRDLPVAMPDSSTYARCRYAAWLHQHWRPVPVMVAGGMGSDETPAYAQTMAHLLESAGIPPGMIWVEGKSRNTHQSAAFGAEMLRGRGINRIVLVTEADNMLRTELCFRKLGIMVVPAAFRRTDLTFSLRELIPGWPPLRRNERALHEYVGLLWYRLHGWI